MYLIIRDAELRGAVVVRVLLKANLLESREEGARERTRIANLSGNYRT